MTYKTMGMPSNYNRIKEMVQNVIPTEVVEYMDPTPETDGSIMFKRGIEIQCSNDGYYINLWSDGMETVEMGNVSITNPNLAVMRVRTMLRMPSLIVAA